MAKSDRRRTKLARANEPPLRNSPKSERNMDMAGTSSNVAGASMSMALRARSFHGPLPSPEIIREYEEIRPDIVDTVLTMALSEQKHRHWREAELIALEREKEKTEQSLIGRGQWLGFAICL